MRDHTMAQKEHTWIPNLGAKGWGITFICICFYFFYNFWNNASNTLFGVLTGMYGWETTQMSFIVTLGGWCSLLGIIVFGVIGRKVGAKNVSIIGLIGSIIAFVILATMSNFTMFAVGTLLFYVYDGRLRGHRPGQVRVRNGSLTRRACSWASRPWA